MSTSAGNAAPRIQVFRPTTEQFKHFSKYIEYIESTGAHRAGLAKIIPPDGWIPRKSGYDDIELRIPSPITQYVSGRQGLYQQFNISNKGLSVKEFRKLAESKTYQTPKHFDYEDLERKYWKNITYGTPIYGADVSGSLYDDGIEEFNIQRLNTILDLVKKDYEIQIEGVNTAYLYFGMWKTTFAWHTEDMDLYSINYVHYGAPKSWYVIPPEHSKRLERLAAGFFHASHSECPAFLRHKMTIISPSILKKFSIPFSRITQEPGEFMITFPYAYHSGFNHGFNIAESTNFALPRWVEYGKRSISCVCRNDCVKICMDIFVRKFQPHRYELWKEGKDVGYHPEDPSRQYAAPAPKKTELRLSAKRQRNKRDKETQKIKRHPVAKFGDESKTYDAMMDTDDEETKIYDISEISKKKGPKKGKKRRRKPNGFPSPKKPRKKQKTTTLTVKKEKIIERVQIREESDIDINMEEEDLMDEETELEEGNIVEEPEYQMDSSTEDGDTEISKIDDAVVANEKDLNDKVEIIPNKITTETPPQLKPFWDPGEKMKTELVVKGDHAGQVEEEYNSKMKLFENYPNLHKAVNSGSFSVVSLHTEVIPNESVWIDKVKTQTAFEQDMKLKPLLSSSQIKYPSFSPIWRCETNGLKIKFVQPKNRLSSISSTSSPIPTQTLSKNDFTPNKLPEVSCSQYLSNTSSELPEKRPTSLNTSTESLVESSVSSQISFNTSIESSDENYVDPQNALSTFTESLTKSCAYPNALSQYDKLTKHEKESQRSSTESSANELHSVEAEIDSVKQNSDIAWARPLTNLWQNQPKNFKAEVAFNEKLASVPPHCAICVIFTPMYNDNSFPTEAGRVPTYSAVKMPAFCYGNTLNSECMLDTNSLLRMDGTAPLLTCSNCKVCVHATCYGISMLPLNSWVCSRCSIEAHEAECCLCALRGGALKPTTDGRWAHIVCAVLIDETFFESTMQKQPVNVSKITPVRQRLKCKYCFKSLIIKESKGACVQCRSGRCYLPFHVTCGYMAGVIFESCDWPEPIHMICTKHVAARRKPPKRELTSVSVGERVIAKHKSNKRYYWANVSCKYIQEYYSILFDDNSHSTNTLPEDIIGRTITHHGTPQMNEKVRVKWPDGVIYNGTFKGSQSCELYVIEFDDGSIMRLERKEIYAADEELPKTVKSKVSHSSASNKIDFVSEMNGKRIRINNHRYS